MSGAPQGRGAVALRYRDFRLLWAGSFFSQIGSQMFVVGIGWQIYDITRSPLALGLLGLSRAVPLVIFALGAGVIADAMDRRRLMLVCQVVMLALSAALGLWTVRGLDIVWPVYLVVALASAARTFETPARQALVPALVPRQHLTNALSLNVLNGQAATVIGPSLAGVVIANLGVAAVYWLDALSYLAVIGSLVFMRVRPEPHAGTSVSLRAALDGIRFLRSEPIILSTMLLDFIATFFGSALTLLPLFARDILRVGPEGLGLLYAAPSAGAVIAGIWMSLVAGSRRQGLLLLAAVMAYGLCTTVFGLSTSFWLSLLMLAGVGAADTISTVIRNTIRQLRTPDELRGRMVSVNMLFFMGGPQLGEFEAGVVARLAGGPFSVWSGGVMCMVAVGLLAWRVPALRTYDEHAAVPA
jgi:MFS family permease